MKIGYYKNFYVGDRIYIRIYKDKIVTKAVFLKKANRDLKADDLDLSASLTVKSFNELFYGSASGTYKVTERKDSYVVEIILKSRRTQDLWTMLLRSLMETYAYMNGLQKLEETVTSKIASLKERGIKNE